jgi:RNA polymerase sigma-70 factor (ECF subfamily)
MKPSNPFPSRGSSGSHDPSADLTVSLDLVRLAQGGDTQALNKLVERYYDRVRRIVRLRLGSNLRECVDSADILQNTFIAAVQSFQAFEMRDEASLINWLSRLAQHQIIAAADYHGAKKRDHRRAVSLPGLGSTHTSSTSIDVQLPADGPMPLEQLAEAEQAEIVERCMQMLPEEYRELLILRNYAGATWETVAEQTGRPSAAAARMMHARAVIELGRLVREQGL